MQPVIIKIGGNQGDEIRVDDEEGQFTIKRFERDEGNLKRVGAPIFLQNFDDVRLLRAACEEFLDQEETNTDDTDGNEK